VLLGTPFVVTDVRNLEKLPEYAKEPRNGHGIPMIRIPPKNPLTNRPHDSIVAECARTAKVKKDKCTLKRYREFVVYDRRACYPEFIIYFRRVPGANPGL
jgi:hypothetical protein